MSYIKFYNFYFSSNDSWILTKLCIIFFYNVKSKRITFYFFIFTIFFYFKIVFFFYFYIYIFQVFMFFKIFFNKEQFFYIYFFSFSINFIFITKSVCELFVNLIIFLMTYTKSINFLKISSDSKLISITIKKFSLIYCVLKNESCINCLNTFKNA